MNNRTEAKLTDLSGMQKGIEGILQQAWERGRKYGQNEVRDLEANARNDLISREALKEEIVALCRNINAKNGITIPTLAFTHIVDNAPTVCGNSSRWCESCVSKGKCASTRPQGKFECRIKIKDLISMLLEFDMNEKATICTTDEYNENNIVISITDMRGNNGVDMRKGEEE